MGGFAALLLVLAAGVPTPYASRLPQTVEGEVPIGGSAAVCSGPYQVDAGSSVKEQACPENTAFFGIDDPAGRSGPGAKISVSGSCCPLPAGDILTDSTSFHLERCPEQSVVTGVRASGSDEYMLRCTKINTARYALSAARASAYWGNGVAGAKGATRIDWKNIPESIRAAQGHMQEKRYDIDGCVGYPWGSMFVAKQNKYCSGLLFSRLTFAGAGSDPAKGTPVRMFR